MSSEVDIAADRAIIAAATPGPWQVPAVNHRLVVAPTPSPQGSLTTIGNFYDGDYASADAGFAAAARTRWPAALDEIERLRADNDTLRSVADVLEEKRRESFGYARDMDAATATLENRLAEQAAEIERLWAAREALATTLAETSDKLDRANATLAEREATIGELRAGLENLRGAVAGVFDFGACYGSRRDFERAASAADALLAKTAPPKEGT